MIERIYSTEKKPDKIQHFMVGNQIYTVLAYDVLENADEGWSWVEFLFKGQKPDKTTIKTRLENYLNDRCDQNILEGFTWKTHPVWLSTENQINYQRNYDAVKENEQFLPEIRLGDNTRYKFETQEEYYQFRNEYSNFIDDCLKNCWDDKDKLDEWINNLYDEE